MAARLSLPLKTRCFPPPGHPGFGLSMRLIFCLYVDYVLFDVNKNLGISKKKSECGIVMKAARGGGQTPLS
jgi:hypothetical protein